MTETRRDLAADLAVWELPPPEPTPGNFDAAKWKWNERRWRVAVEAFPQAARRALAAEAEVERLWAELAALRAATLDTDEQEGDEC